VSGSGICWTICKAALHPRHITMPAPHHSVFLQAGCPSCHLANIVKALKARAKLLRHLLFQLSSNCTGNWYWRAGIKESFFRSPIVDEEWMRPGHHFGSVLYVLLKAWTWVTGKASVKSCAIQMFISGTNGEGKLRWSGHPKFVWKTTINCNCN